MKDYYYSVKEIAEKTNKHKSTIHRKLTEEVLNHINKTALMNFKKETRRGNVEQFVFNEYATKYIISLFYNEIDYDEIEEIPLSIIEEKIKSKKIESKLNNIEQLIKLISNQNSKTIDILSIITNIKSDFNKLIDENRQLKWHKKLDQKHIDEQDIYIVKQEEEIDFLKNEILKRLKKD
ncbi:hypothetical protein ACF043_12835 [Staphylococcus warneri]|uniref:hypothetical protein n=1 Tax=Staphylococcus TaxID=1279 RepID=UPI0011A06975|nr:hypothetical protein [Staphylococcus epidermidis]